MHIFNFREIEQYEDEPFDDFVARLSGKANFCNFENTETEILNQIIQKCSSDDLKKKALETGNLTLKNLIELGRLQECVATQIKELSRGSTRSKDINHISSSTRHHTNEAKTVTFSDKNFINSDKVYEKSNRVKRNYGERKQKFRNCGGSYPHEKRCPAFGATCHNCDKPNHYAKCCRSSKPNNFEPRFQRAKKINNLETNVDSSSEEESFGWGLNIKRMIRSIGNLILPLIAICHTWTSFTVDTGAETNVLDEETWRRLKIKPTLLKNNESLYVYDPQNKKIPLPVLGMFSTRTLYNGCYKRLVFQVVAGNGGNLLGYESAVRLGVIEQIQDKGKSLKLVSKSPNKTVVTEDPLLSEPKTTFPNAFANKIGLLKDFKVTLHIDKTIKPIQQKLRHIPFHLRDPVATEIKNMLDQDIIEPVEGPTPWVSPIVPVPKVNYPGEIRICTDAKAPNEAILPNIFNTNIRRLRSRYITAFCTHLGIFIYKRLNFGINTAAEIFQKAIEQVISGIEGSFNIIDDIIVFGRNEAEHDQSLQRVLEQIDKSGLTINVKKCEFKKRELDFFGLHFSEKGVSIETAKRDALLQARFPKTASEVRSFLGLAQYCNRFISELAIWSKPLRILTKKNIKWSWTTEHEEAFNKIREKLVTDAMAYFDIDKRSEVTVDASPTGLALVFAQYIKNQPENKKIIRYDSRSLSEIERKYSQVEREALVVG